MTAYNDLRAQQAAARRVDWEREQREIEAEQDRLGLIRGIQSAVTLAGLCVVAVLVAMWILRSTP